MRCAALGHGHNSQRDSRDTDTGKTTSKFSVAIPEGAKATRFEYRCLRSKKKPIAFFRKASHRLQGRSTVSRAEPTHRACAQSRAITARSAPRGHTPTRQGYTASGLGTTSFLTSQVNALRQQGQAAAGRGGWGCLPISGAFIKVTRLVRHPFDGFWTGPCWPVTDVAACTPRCGKGGYVALTANLDLNQSNAEDLIDTEPIL